MTGIMGRTGRTWCCHVEVDVGVDVGVEMEVEVERGGVMVLGDGGDGEVAWLAGVAVRQSGCVRLANGGRPKAAAAVAVQGANNSNQQRQRRPMSCCRGRRDMGR
jgi:hypothetical protein